MKRLTATLAKRLPAAACSLGLVMSVAPIEVASRAGAASMNRQAPQPAPDHDLEFRRLHRAFYTHLQRGQYRKAAEILGLVRDRRAAERKRDEAARAGDRTAASYQIDMIARFALERQQWTEAMAVPTETTDPAAMSTVWYARGLAAARTAWPGGKADMIRLAREAAGRLETMAARDGRRSLAEIERLAVQAAIAAAQEERDELALLLAHATGLAEATLPVDEPCLPIIPIQELAGDLWLQVHRYADAQRAYAAALKRYPGRGRSLYGLARASAKAGDTAAARRAYAAFLEAWNDADPDRPERAEARAYLGIRD